MTLETLTIHGLLRFENTVTVDFRELPAGVIAVVGQNGSGKTSLLESAPAALYRQFPTRPDHELFDYAHGRDGYLEATFVLEGRGQYRARVNVDGLRRTSDAVLEQITGDGMRQVLNDGKVSTYDLAVARIFPPAVVLYASAFATQNRSGSFATVDRKTRSKLFTALLNLDHYEQMAQVGRTAGGLVADGIVKLEARRDILRRETAPGQREALEAEIARLDSAQRAAWEAHTLATDTVGRLEAEAAALQAGVEQAIAAAERQRSCQQQLSDLDAQREVLSRRASQLQNDAITARQRLDQEHARGLADIDVRLTKNAELLTDAEAIRQATRLYDETEASLVIARDAVTEAQDLVDTAARAVQEATAALATLETAQRDLQATRTTAAMRDSVPCGGAEGFADCRFLTNATAAAARIHTLAAAITDAADAGPRVTLAGETHSAARAALAARQRYVTQLSEQRQRASTKAQLRDKLAAAEARIVELEHHKADLIAGATVARERIAYDLALRLKACGDDQASLADRRQVTAAALASATADLAAAEPARLKATTVAAQLTLARKDVEQATKDSAQAEAGLQVLARRRDALNALGAQLADVEARLATLGTELLQWQLLAKALGREGLPVLEIDAAGPTVSAICNDLLMASFGARFAVELVTQEAKASGKGLKESFELKVFDNQQGGDARDLGDLSGGEQVLVDEALKNAIAIYMNQRNEAPLRTLWRDECSAPLDADNSIRYMQMLKRVCQIGGFEKAIVVTHDAAAAALADAQIRVADGAVTISLPPFSEAA